MDAQQHDTDTAAVHYERNLEIFRELRPCSYETMTLTCLGNLVLGNGQFDRAQDMHEQPVAMFAELQTTLRVHALFTTRSSSFRPAPTFPRRRAPASEEPGGRAGLQHPPGIAIGLEGIAA